MSKNCHGITLTNNKRIISIDRLQFITSIVNNPESLCFAIVATHRKQTDRKEKEIYEQVLADFDILNPDTWPEGDEKHLRYGEENTKKKKKKFVQYSVWKTSDQF
jgi:hypothetical protein